MRTLLYMFFFLASCGAALPAAPISCAASAGASSTIGNGKWIITGYDFGRARLKQEADTNRPSFIAYRLQLVSGGSTRND